MMKIKIKTLIILCLILAAASCAVAANELETTSSTSAEVPPELWVLLTTVVNGAVAIFMRWLEKKKMRTKLSNQLLPDIGYAGINKQKAEQIVKDIFGS